MSNYEIVPYVETFTPKVGDVYVINVDKFHSFKCNGPNPRIILQTKFKNILTFGEACDILDKQSFNNLKK